MARVRPFRGIRYDRDRIGGDLTQVTTPPYDQINAAGAEAFHMKDEHSYIRLILARQTAQDTDAENRYTRAERTLKTWLQEGILTQDGADCFYVYRQTFQVLGQTYTRTGLMAAVHVEPNESGVILRHERTLPKHVDDRLNLLRRTRTQFESIFLLYDDPRNETAQQLDGKPDLELTDDVGTGHQLWRVSDPTAVAALQSFFQDKTLLIADGHHRYQTTGLLAKETGNDEDAWVLATLYRVEDPGVVILPTHRVVKNVPDFDANRLLDDLKSDFDVESFPGDADALTAALRQRAGDHVLGLYTPATGNAILRLKGEHHLPTDGEHSRAWHSLDVAILHELILDRRLGITLDKVAKEGNLEYHRWPKDAVQVVDQDNAQAVFFLNATRPTQVRDLATKGELMPQKSTDFYPKLLSGLVAMPLRTAALFPGAPLGAPAPK